ncbi:unnamed protein product, partial [Vicia faba]
PGLPGGNKSKLLNANWVTHIIWLVNQSQSTTQLYQGMQFPSFSAYMLSLWIPILYSQSTVRKAVNDPYTIFNKRTSHYPQPFTVIFTTKPVSEQNNVSNDAMIINFVPKLLVSKLLLTAHMSTSLSGTCVSAASMLGIMVVIIIVTWKIST